MKTKKKQKNKRKKPAVKKRQAKKVPKRIKKLKSRKSIKPKSKTPTKKRVDEALKMERLITRGKERGFVTYDEILKEFPTIETNIMFLDELYEKLHTLGIDIL